MFKKGTWTTQPLQLLKYRLERNSSREDYSDKFLRRMVEVEFGLRLMERLDLLEEPLVTLPSLLALHRLPALRQFSDSEWRLIAYARFRIPAYISNQRWQDDLRDYARLPAEAKLYRVHEQILPEEQSLRVVLHDAEFVQHLEAYDQVLDARPPYNYSPVKLAYPGKTFHFYMVASEGNWRQPVSVDLPEMFKADLPIWANEIGNEGDDEKLDAYVRPRQKSKRIPLSLGWDTLVNESEIMHASNPKDNWRQRIRDIRLVNKRGDQVFHLDGQTHLVGMVGAGKSTLIKIVAHHLTRTAGATIAVLVPSTIEAFKFANEMNHLLGCDWNAPAAVVYYGWTNRAKYVDAFLEEYGSDPTHFGHRWVSTTCGLMSLVSHDIMTQMPSVPQPGSEPCQTLSDSPLQPPDSEEKFAPPARNKTCPLFSTCPSHQKLRDLGQARIIVTTAGALQSRLPNFFDPRGLLLADYIYEQADIIFIDESDEVQAFQDDQFVNMVPLWNLPRALFSGADASVSESLRHDYLSEIQENWAFSHRDGAKYILPMLRMLHRTGNKSLLTWIGRSYFSAYRSFQTVARRLIGLPDWTSYNDMSEMEKRQYDYLSAIFSMFTARDFTKIPDPDYAPANQIRGYGSEEQVRCAIKLRAILTQATWNLPRDFEGDLLALLKWMLAEIKIDLDESLHKYKEKIEEDRGENSAAFLHDYVETGESLAHKLMFCLLTAGLDREIRALVYNADSQPDQVATVLDIRDFNPNFRSAHAALPIAYTGSIFGTYYTPDDRPPEQNSGQRGQREALARLEYVNPGRELLMRFHNLYQLFGIEGPHVVFLSGTSYLPDSTRWHIRTPIENILEANPGWQDTILKHSEYHFTPAFDDSNQPIRVSGAGSSTHETNRAKEDALRGMARYWGLNEILEKQLADLRERGEQYEFWLDRDRILIFVNSYDQSEILGRAIRQYTKSLSDDQVQWLARDGAGYGGIARSSIENVARTDIRVLVAPLAAIGRGHNILTEDAKRAAFGAAYFAVRPLNPPGDVNGIAAEINALGADWLSSDKPHADLLKVQQIYQQENALRRLALEQWHRGERRTYYHRLEDDERRDLAATTLGRFVQASGRLVRGGVPMLIYFADAAWAPESARRQAGKHRKRDTPRTSLLVEMICRLKHYTRAEDPIGQVLYKPFWGLLRTNGLYFKEDDCDE